LAPCYYSNDRVLFRAYRSVVQDRVLVCHPFLPFRSTRKRAVRTNSFSFLWLYLPRVSFIFFIISSCKKVGKVGWNSVDAAFRSSLNDTWQSTIVVVHSFFSFLVRTLWTLFFSIRMWLLRDKRGGACLVDSLPPADPKKSCSPVHRRLRTSVPLRSKPPVPRY